MINIGKNGRIVFNGNCNIGEGCSIRADNGQITFGKNFDANKNFTINLEKSINLGDNCLIGTEVNLRDSNGHKMIIKEYTNIKKM